MRAKMAYVRKNIAELVIKYGPWGGCVATQSGEVIHCAQYALAAKMTRTPLTVFVIPDVEKEKYQSYLNKTYGVFEYSHLEKTTYIQTYAQLMRLRNGGSLKSNLYESLILPIIAKTPRGIDFGSGQETTRECSGQRDITCMISSFSAVRALETLWIGPQQTG